MSSSIEKYIYQKNEQTPGCIISYELKHFNIGPGSGPHFCKHEIMTKEEIENEITKHHKLSVNDLKKIAKNDAQLQFLRAKIGDVIRISNISRYGGHQIDYRVVTKPMEKGDAIKSSGKQKSDQDELEIDSSADEISEPEIDGDSEGIASESESESEDDIFEEE